MNGDPDPLELLRRGDEDAVRELVARAQQASEERLHPAAPAEVGAAGAA